MRIHLQGMKKRAIANVNWLKTQTLMRMDQAVTSKPTRPIKLEKQGMLV